MRGTHRRARKLGGAGSDRTGSSLRKLGTGRARRAGECGYALLAVIAALSVILIAATSYLPDVVWTVQREREEEMLFRGQEIVEAIERFYQMTRRYPMNLKQLADGVVLRGTRRIRFLRPSALTDPMTNEEWKLIRPGDPVLKRFVEAYLESIGQPGNRLLQQFVRTGGQINIGATGAGIGLGSGRAGAGASPRTSRQQYPMQRAVQPQWQREGQAGDPFGGEGAEEGQVGGEGALTQTLGREYAAESEQQGEGNAPTLGVVSKSEKTAIRVYYDLEDYKDWAFIFIPPEFLPAATGEARVRAFLNPVMFPSDPLSRMVFAGRAIVRPVMAPGQTSEGRQQVPRGDRGVQGRTPQR